MNDKCFSYYIIKSISKYYSVPIALIGFVLTAMSSFGFVFNKNIPFSIFFASLLILIFIIILLVISLYISVRDVGLLSRVSYDFGVLPKVISISHDSKSDYTKILLDHKGESYLEKDYLVSIMFKIGDGSVCEVAVGVINNVQPDGKVVVFVEPISKHIETWTNITSNPDDYYDRVFAKTLIHKDYYKKSLYEELRETRERKLEDKYQAPNDPTGDLKL